MTNEEFKVTPGMVAVGWPFPEKTGQCEAGARLSIATIIDNLLRFGQNTKRVKTDKALALAAQRLLLASSKMFAACKKVDDEVRDTFNAQNN